ncbi:hypothetical protein BJX61DRAFT_247300 [Aspergillus egyptiacus]|nr:hypothetical protein BJX61DRAFT_247300 [Aspergillus egyptiacus]
MRNQRLFRSGRPIHFHPTSQRASSRPIVSSCSNEKMIRTSEARPADPQWSAALLSLSLSLISPSYSLPSCGLILRLTTYIKLWSRDPDTWLGKAPAIGSSLRSLTTAVAMCLSPQTELAGQATSYQCTISVSQGLELEVRQQKHDSTRFGCKKKQPLGSIPQQLRSLRDRFFCPGRAFIYSLNWVTDDLGPGSGVTATKTSSNPVSVILMTPNPRYQH